MERHGVRRHGRGRRRRAGDRRPRGRHAALQAVAGRHRESDARPLARRRAGRCRRGLRTRGDAPSPAQRGVSRRRLRPARAWRSGIHRCRGDSIRSRLGASALQRRPDRPDRIVGHCSPGGAIRRGPGSRGERLDRCGQARRRKRQRDSRVCRGSGLQDDRRRQRCRRHDAPAPGRPEPVTRRTASVMFGWRCSF